MRPEVEARRLEDNHGAWRSWDTIDLRRNIRESIRSEEFLKFVEHLNCVAVEAYRRHQRDQLLLLCPVR